MSQSTSVARVAQEATGVGHVPTDEEIEGIRQAGKQVAAYRKEVNALYRVLDGLSWGSGKSVVQGSDLSPQTRYAMAEFCRITRANPMQHLDVLGNKPYLNAAYWSDLINSHESFHRYEQRDLSPSVEQALRDRAERHRRRAAGLEGPEAAQRLAKALDLEEEADDIATARAQWSPRANATVVIETTIWRFMNAAPMEAIRSGEIVDFERYLVRVTECNWAGGMGDTLANAKKWDPIGDANPGTTARTRSLRRAATKAFSAWMDRYEEQIRKAEEAVEAEFEIITDDARAARASLPGPGEPQAVSTGSGEPSAASSNGALALPIEGRGAPPPAPSPAPPPAPDQPAGGFDVSGARKRLFATLRDAGFDGERRKAWQEEHKLPASTNDWTEADYVRAQELLVGPHRQRVEEGCTVLGENLADLSLRILGKESPQFLSDWLNLGEELQSLADAR